jgi:hypothetical protein
MRNHHHWEMVMAYRKGTLRVASKETSGPLERLVLTGSTLCHATHSAAHRAHTAAQHTCEAGTTSEQTRSKSSGWSSLAAPYATQLTEPHTAHTQQHNTRARRGHHLGTDTLEVERLVLSGSTLCHATH